MSPPPPDELKSQVDAWAANRRLYPGWVIAPYQTRDTIWSWTHGWIQPILRSLPALPPVQRLSTLDELNWRLETALVPLFTDLVEAITRALEEINPFPQSLRLPQPSISLNPENESTWNWADLRRMWLRLAFAVLRYFREERQHERFGEWTDRIQSSLETHSQDQHRLAYERCLAALGNMDDAAATTALAGWPSDPQDQIWQLRRASVLIELGRLREAETLVETALRSIRTQAKPGADDILRMSREGWAMALLSGLQHHRWLIGTGSRPDNRGRWDHLTQYRCNPQLELNLFESKLEQSPPQAQPQVTIRPGFHPASYTRSYHGGDPVGSKLLPAYQFMRLTEEAPYPPNCGNFMLSQKQLQQTAGWFAAHDTVRALTLTCRLLSGDVIKSFLTRQRVAALPIPMIEDLYTCSTRAVQGAISRAQAVEGAPESAIVERARNQLECGIGIWGRVVPRLPPERVSESLTMAIALYRSPAVQNDLALPERLGDLLQSLILALPRETLAARAVELLALPVPGSPSFLVRLIQGWPLVAQLLENRLSRLIRNPRSAEWQQIVAHCLEAARSANWEVRRHAMARLLLLQERGCLMREELRQLRSLLWENVSERTQLPDMPGVQNFTYLSLPEPRRGMTLSRFRRYLREGDLQRFYQQTTAADGTPRRSIVLNSNADFYLRDWLGATDLARGEATQGTRPFIRWTRADAVMLLDKMRVWWREEGRELMTTTEGTFFPERMRTQPVRNRIALLLTALECIVIPQLRPGTSSARQVIELVGEIDSCAVPVEAALPALLRLQPEAVRETARRLRRSLATNDEERQQASLFGLTSWLRNHTGSNRAIRGYRLPPLPEDLLQEVGSRVANRRQPGLRDILGTAIVVVRDFPERANRRFVESLTLGLHYLLTETQYRLDESASGQIPAAEIPTYRLLAAQLAGLLGRLPRGRSDIINQWLEIARQDPLPEIRRAIEAPAGPESEG